MPSNMVLITNNSRNACAEKQLVGKATSSIPDHRIDMFIVAQEKFAFGVIWSPSK